jgi:hypothetical protein
MEEYIAFDSHKYYTWVERARRPTPGSYDSIAWSTRLERFEQHCINASQERR